MLPRQQHCKYYNRRLLRPSPNNSSSSIRCGSTHCCVGMHPAPPTPFGIPSHMWLDRCHLHQAARVARCHVQHGTNQNTPKRGCADMCPQLQSSALLHCCRTCAKHLNRPGLVRRMPQSLMCIHNQHAVLPAAVRAAGRAETIHQQQHHHCLQGSSR